MKIFKPLLLIFTLGLIACEAPPTISGTCTQENDGMYHCQASNGAVIIWPNPIPTGSPIPQGAPSTTPSVAASASPTPLASPLPVQTPDPSPTPSPLPSSPQVEKSPAIPTPPPVTQGAYDDPTCSGVNLGGWKQDADGWTVLPNGKALGAHVVCVTLSGTGNDPLCTQYVKTLKAGTDLLRHGQGDQLLLHRGETFGAIDTKNFGGKSMAEPMVLGAYGAGPRPVVKAGLYLGTWVSNLIVQSLDFQDTRSTTGITVQGNWTDATKIPIQNLLFEDLRIQNFKEGLTINPGQNVLAAKNIVIRRTQILDNYAPDKSQGLYAENIKGLLLEENTFHHNGFANRGAGGGLGGNIFSHNMYLQTRSQCLVVRGNISAEAASHGLQQRSGGVLENNFFIRNPLHVSYALVGGGSVDAKHIDPGVVGRVVGNAMIESVDINPTLPRGYGLQMGNIRKALIQDNLIQGYTPGPKNYSVGLDINAGMGIGIHNVTMKNVRVSGFVTPMQKGGSGWGAVVLKKDGSVTNPAGKLLITAAASGIPPQPQDQSISDSGFDSSGVQQLTKPANLNLGAYLGQPQLTGDQAFNQFITSARNQSKGSWDPKFTGTQVAKYFVGAK
jgi:hypothetical protein